MPLLRKLLLEILEDVIREGLNGANKDDAAIKAIIQAVREAGWTPPPGFDE